MRAIFRYPGSKWSLAGWIISHFPADYEKMVYLEPFCGSGAVFFNKRPGAVETINDLSGDVVNLFRVLRESPEELMRVLALTPYSREEYDLSFVPTDEPLEKARRFMVRTNQSIGAKLDGKCGWRNHKQRKIGGTACKWGGITDTIDLAAQRLRGSTTNLVQIERMDALRLIERYNSPEVLMYIDTPYLKSTRKSGRLYSHEMDGEQHGKLLKLLKESQAKVVLVCSMADLFGEWVLEEWIEEVFEACKKAPQHRYLFLTKNPERYISLAKAGILPEEDNFWYGSSAPTQDSPFWWSDYHNTFVSIEPMREEFKCARHGGDFAQKWIILGAMTGPGGKRHSPMREWVENIVEVARASGTPVFMKDSLLPIMGEENMLREFPWKEAALCT